MRASRYAQYKGTVQNGEVQKASDNDRTKLTLYNRIHGTRLLTEAAVDALGHVNVYSSKSECRRISALDAPHQS